MADIKIHSAPLKSPFTICFWITEICNLQCKYCFAAPLSGKIMEYNRLIELIDELIELEVFDMIFAGGEPLLHPNVFEILKKPLEDGFSVGLLTNGVLLNNSTRRMLERLPNINNLIIQISLDSPDPFINNKTRGQGEKVLNNLIELSKSGIKIQVASVLTKFNIETAHLVIERLYPAVKRYHFLTVQRTETSLKNSELLISDEQSENFWNRLYSYSKKFPNDLLLPSLPASLKNSREKSSFSHNATFSCNSCSAGLTNINIDANFNVLGCDIAKDFTYMGNVMNKSFESVWNSERAAIVRNAPFPACYNIKSPSGYSLKCSLKDKYLGGVIEQLTI